MKRLVFACVRLTLALMMTAAVGFAQYNTTVTLHIGDPAPPIKVQTWLRGQPVTQFEKGKVYVLDFWATWCGGCIISFPHISGIAEKYKDRVSFSSIDTKEDIDGGKVDAVARVTEFLKTAWAKPLTLDIAVDGDSGAMWNNWIKPLRRGGLPTTYVIDQEGKIAWVDVNIDNLDWVLDQVLAKKWDRAKAAAVMQKRDAIDDMFLSAFRSDKSQQKEIYQALLAAAEGFEKEFPDRKAAVAFYKFWALADLDKARVPDVLEQMASDPLSRYINLSDAAGLTMRSKDLSQRTYAAVAKVLERCLQNEYPAMNTCGKTVTDYSRLATAYELAGDVARAAAAIDEAIVLGNQQHVSPEQYQKLQESSAKYKVAKYSGSPAARAEFEKATAAKRANEWDKAVAGFKKAIELDANYSDAHLQYANAAIVAAAYRKMQSGGAPDARDAFKTITSEYEGLVRDHPTNPVNRWILAMFQIYSSPETKEKYCREANDLDPYFGPAYGCLASVSELRGDTKTTVSLLRRGLGVNPNDKDLWRQLQDAVQHDPEEFKKTTTEIVNKFPDDDAAVFALYQYANKMPEAERIAKLEEIVAKYPLNKFRTTSLAASTVLAYFDRTDPSKAIAFAHSIADKTPDDKGWKATVVYEDSMAAAEAKIAAGDGAGALAILKDVKPGFGLSSTRLQLLKAKAQDSSGNTQTAYTELLKTFSDQPLPQVRPVLYQFGKKLNKSDKDVDNEVWALRTSNAKPAIPFSLESFVDGKKVSLDDFKGKVVIVDFWYPSCGPCMLAMPYMHKLWVKYKDSGVVFLGVNGMEGEESLVMPLVKARGWGFIPLKGNQKWGEEVYKVSSYPSTFFIGPDGKVYFRPHTYDQEHYEIAEMEIESLLALSKQSNKNQ